jgi:hypothetical protein
MNGLILHSSPENKDIKFNAKNSKDTAKKETGELFEKLVKSLVKDKTESKNSGFLLAKLLNLPTEFETDGQTPSLFSKDEVMDLLKVTKSDKKDKNDNVAITLEELFKIALNLKEGGTFNTDNPKISKEITLKLNSKSVIADLKSAKNIKELLNIAEKNGIKVKNFEFFKEESAIDPNDKKLVQKVASAEIFKFIRPKTQNHKNSLKTDHKHFTTDHKPSKQNILAKLINNTKQSSEHIDKITTTDQKDNKHSKELSQKPDNNFDLDIEAETENFIKNTQTVHNKKSKNSKTITALKSDIKDEKVANQKIDLVKVKTSNEESQNSAKIEVESTDQIEKNSHTHDIKDIKADTNLKTKEPNEVKKSLNTFASEFKEKLESYKAPLMKIKMQLTPQNLGDVDVTLLNRGSTLHVNITSNTQSMALFMQNQAEFRNSLVNMGFSDLQMNFSQNQNGKNQQESKNKNSNAESFESFNADEDSTESINIAIPNYV